MYGIDCIWLEVPEIAQFFLSSFLKKGKDLNENQNNTQLLPEPVPKISKQNYLVKVGQCKSDLGSRFN